MAINMWQFRWDGRRRCRAALITRRCRRRCSATVPFKLTQLPSQPAHQVVEAVPTAVASEGEVGHLAQFFTARLTDW